MAYGQARWLMTRRDLPSALASLRGGTQPRSATSGPDMPRAGRRLAGTISKSIGRLPADSRCLVRSLVLTRLLARRGVATTLVIGVHPGSDFAAHAWVEHRGDPLLWTGEPRYQRLTEL